MAALTYPICIGGAKNSVPHNDFLRKSSRTPPFYTPLHTYRTHHHRHAILYHNVYATAKEGAGDSPPAGHPPYFFQEGGYMVPPLTLWLADGTPDIATLK